MSSALPPIAPTLGAALDARRLALKAKLTNHETTVTGISDVSVVTPANPGDSPQIRITLLAPWTPPAEGGVLVAANFVIRGGVRIVDPTVTDVHPDPQDENSLILTVPGGGDFSTYMLAIVDTAPSESDLLPPPGFDPMLSASPLSFHPECPSDDDCGARPTPVPGLLGVDPGSSYLAKDYTTLRDHMLGRISSNVPSLDTAHPLDLTVTLVELLAYVADQASYRQDSADTEAYLPTARLRTSLRRHSRLVDYRPHDGCTARAWVRLIPAADVAPAGAAALPAGSMLITGVPGEVDVPGGVVTSTDADRMIAAGAIAFQTAYDVAALHADLVQISLHDWGFSGDDANQVTLPAGSVTVTLKGTHDALAVGDVVVIAEVLGPTTGDGADADPTLRWAVRLTNVVTEDSTGSTLTDPVTGDALTVIEWDAADATPRAFVLASYNDGSVLREVSAVWGNVVLADAGRFIEGSATIQPVGGASMAAEQLSDVAAPLDAGPDWAVVPRYRPRLAQGPLTFAVPLPAASNPGPATAALAVDPHSAVPAIDVWSDPGSEAEASWDHENELVSARPTDHRFVVEVEDDGSTRLRFGDGSAGVRPEPDQTFFARYRVGNGATGNIGAERLTFLVDSGSAAASAKVGVTNPLPAWGGTAPETADQIVTNAPVKFLRQERAVSLSDYETLARAQTGVAGATARIRWAGSWPTVVVLPDTDEAPLPNGGADLLAALESARMAGRDVDLGRPTLVPLTLALTVCCQPDAFHENVRDEILAVLTTGLQPDGSPGLLNPKRFGFGEPVYLSPFLVEVAALPGVADVTATIFGRLADPTGGLADGRIKLHPMEIATLDNDPNRPDRGLVKLTFEGGR